VFKLFLACLASAASVHAAPDLIVTTAANATLTAGTYSYALGWSTVTAVDMPEASGRAAGPGPAPLMPERGMAARAEEAP